MKPPDRVRIQHILDAAHEALHFVHDESRESLEQDRKLAFAVLRAIEIIGEAAAHVSQECRMASPQIPWGANHWDAQPADSCLF